MNLKKLDLSVGKRIVKTEIKKLKTKDLSFYPKNPRISSLLLNYQGKLNNDIIHKMMWKGQGEATRTLFQRVKKDGIINEPVIVYNGQVLEGNTRLAVVRQLLFDAKNKSEKQKWETIPCRAIFGKISEDEIEIILANNHIKKKKDWEPFELACYFADLHLNRNKTTKEIKEISEISETKIKDYIQTYQEMVRLKAKSQEFSAIYETVRQPEVKRVMKMKEYDVLKKVHEKLKSGEIKKASDVRKVAVVLRDSKSKEAFLSNKKDLYAAEQLAIIRNPEEADTQLKKIIELTDAISHMPVKSLLEFKKNKTKMKKMQELVKEINSLWDELNR